MLYNKSQQSKLYLLILFFCLFDIYTTNARVIKNIAATPAIVIMANTTDACRNTSIQFTAAVTKPSGSYTLQWKKNNQDVGSDSINYTAECFPGDVVMCVLTSGSTVISSNSITLGGSNSNTQPVVTISADKTSACDGTPITFIAINVSGSTSVSFNWLIDGKDLGNDNDTFVIASIYHNSIINCIMSAPACRGYWSSISNDIHITTYHTLTPSVSITTRNTSVCQGRETTFTADANAGSRPSYQWKINGNNTGTDSPEFAIQMLKDGDAISCIVTADASEKCYTPAVVSSNVITVKVSPELNGGYFHILSSANNICAGTNVSFTSDFILPQNGSFTWQVNDTNVKTFPYYNVFTTDTLKNGDHVRCVYKSDDACMPVWISDTVSINVKPSPVITLIPADTAIKSGSQVQLKASIRGAVSNYTWSPPDKLVSAQTFMPFTIPLNSAVTYTLHAASNNGCAATALAKIRMIYILEMPNSFTPNGDGLNDVFRIPPPAELNLKNFSVYNRWGHIVFTTTDPAKAWDGKLNGIPLQTGTYIYSIKASNELGDIFQKGTVLLIR